MEFNSIVFLIFILLFFCGYPFLIRQSQNVRWLYFVCTSFVFYGWWNWHYIFIIIFSGLIDFFASLYIVKYPKTRKIILWISLMSNLGILILFKYSLFFVTKLAWISNVVGWELHSSTKLLDELILPVGISFYTFQSMSYTIDVYRDKLIPTRNVLHFFSYLSLFPQLVAGPIVRAKDFLPQLLKVRKISTTEKWHGLKLISMGYFKKVVLADNIAPFVNSAFSNDLSNESSGFWWLVIIGFALQIYFDFSGYSDIARGLAKWMGFHFRLNFNHPYFSNSLKEFWTRWHISLSGWFRDYLYIPMGGSRHGKIGSGFNLLATMTLSGLWHGASSHFMVWGFLHGFLLLIERSLNLSEWTKKTFTTKAIGLLWTLLAIIITWIFFRAKSSIEALQILNYMFSFKTTDYWGQPDVFRIALIFISLSIIIELAVAFVQPFWRRNRNNKYVIISDVVGVSLLLLASVYMRGIGQQFIYFQF